MKAHALVVGFIGLAPVACGSDVVETVEFGEVCGLPSPFRVLDLDPGEHLIGAPEHVGSRVLYRVGPYTDDPDATFPRTTTSTVWATGPCGESPVKVATNIDTLFTVDAWPGEVLGCRLDTGDVFALDPSGALEPQLVYTDVGHFNHCGLRWTPHGMLSIVPHDDETLGALVLHPYATNPWDDVPEPVILAESIRSSDKSRRGGIHIIGNILRSFDEFVLAVTPDNTLIRVNLDDRSTSFLKANVVGFDASRSGRYILWQDDTITTPDENYPEGKILFADLDEGTSTLIGESSLARSSFPMTFADEGIFTFATSDLDQRLFVLPDFESIEFPAKYFLSAVLDGNRWLASSLRDGFYDLVDVGAGTHTQLFPRETSMLEIDSEAAMLLEVSVGDFRAQSPLWRVPLDGGEPERRAQRATQRTRFLDDGRLLTPVEIDADWLSTLILVEANSELEQQIDDHVAASSLDTTSNDEGIVTYSVSDGDRSGVYLARLPP